LWYELQWGDVTCVFTSRDGGKSQGAYRSLNLSYGIGDDPESVFENRTRLERALGIDHMMTLRQTHSSIVHYYAGASPRHSEKAKAKVKTRVLPLPRSASPVAAEAFEGDALFSDSPGAALGVKVADCLPIYFFSEASPVIGLAHAGWRGTLARIAEQTVLAISGQLNVGPESLVSAFGPCIRESCYEVGPDVAEAFRSAFPSSVASAAGRTFLDLKQANRQMLCAMGLREIASLDLCTHCSPDLFFSARRDGVTGRNMALIFRRS
jgi:YfiH family protein